MPGGALKLTNKISDYIIFHKPYYKYNKLLLLPPNLSSTSTFVDSPKRRTRTGTTILRLSSSAAARWPMTTLCAPAAQQPIINRRRSFASSSSSSNKEPRSQRTAAAAAAAAGYPKLDSEMPDCNPPPQKVLTLPTILTIGRVASIPFLVGTFYAESWWGPTATTGIFIAAAVTDWLDGYLARKMKLGTPFGAFLDPVADKLMVAATLILLCTKPFEAGVFGQASWLLTVPAIAIIGREITMSAVREWAASQDKKLLEAVAVNSLGKWKTASQMSALTILLASRDSSLVGAGPLVSSGVVLLYISACLALWSLVVYMRKIWKVLLRL